MKTSSSSNRANLRLPGVLSSLAPTHDLLRFMKQGNPLRRALTSAALAMTVLGLIQPALADIDNTGTGGTITYTDASGLNPRSSPPYVPGYVVHAFTGSGTLDVPVAVTADVLVVGGGGGGGGTIAGGGGGGGLIYSTSVPVPAGANAVVVGAGGAGEPADGWTKGSNGSNSSFGSSIAYGGGGGGGWNDSGGLAGGSGGGGVNGAAGGSGTSGQGNNGGGPNGDNSSGGGGGAGSVGINGVGGTQSGNGGAGLENAISGISTWYAGGGGGGGGNGAAAGAGGNGGGGAGGPIDSNIAGTNGAAGTGGGGGGGGWNPAPAGGDGGSGIVIVKYPYTTLSLSVAVSSPTADQMFPNGSPISATAAVMSGTGPYSVQFYKKVGAGTFSPEGSPLTGDGPTFSLSLGTLTNNTYQIYATVSDSAGPPAATASSESNPTTFTVVDPVPTATALESSLNPSTYPQAVIYTATVSPTPTGGTVQFYDGGDPLGSPVAVDTGTGMAHYNPGVLSATTHSITAHFSGYAQYLASDANGASGLSQIVDKALLTVTADNKVRAPGTANPAFTYKITGYQNGDTLAVVGGTADFSCPTALDNSTVEGAFPITGVVGTLTATNYYFTTADGTLTVMTGAPPVANGMVCWYDAASITVEDGSQVNTWNDQSGSGHTATRASGNPVISYNDIKYESSAAPKKGVHFRGTDDWFDCAGGMFVKEQYVVVRSPNPTWVGSGSFLGRKSDDFLKVRASSHNFYNGYSGFWDDELPAAVSKNGVVVSSSSGSMPRGGFELGRINDYMVLKIVVNENATAANRAAYPYYQIGRTETLSGVEMDIAEIIGYETTLSAGDEAALGFYLENKYGIPTAYADVTPQANITSFSINGLPTVIDQARREITVTAMSPVDLSVLVPTFTLSDGASCTVGGATVTTGVTQVNYSPAHYIVTSSDSSKTTDYTVRVHWAALTGKVNLNIDYNARSGLVGPGGGSGTTWNTTSGDSKSSLFDSGGSVTSVGFTTTNLGGPDGWGDPSLDMIKQGLRNFDTSGGNSQQLVINGLDSARTYNLYIASANLSDQRHNGVWVTTNTTSTPGDHACGNTDVANGTTWFEGNNFVLFKDVVPDGTGKITVNGHSIFVDGFDCRLPMSGFQLVDLTLTALPPAVISGVIASPSIPVGSTSVTLSGTVSDGAAVYAADGEAVSVTIDGVTHYAAIAGGAGAFSIAFPTASLPVNSYPITYAYVGNVTTLLAAPNHDTTALTVTTSSAGAAVISGVASASISGGADTVHLTGMVSDGGSVYPNAGDLVPVTIHGATHDAVISGSSGAFAIDFPTASIPFSGIPYPVTYNYAGNGSTLTAAAPETTTTLTVVDPYVAWIAGFFPPGADRLRTADADGDGKTNQEEFAFGLNPNSATSVNPITKELNKTTGMFTYIRRATPAVTGITYSVWTSTTLAADGWTLDAAATQIVVLTAGGVETVDVTLGGSKPLTGPKLFVRVKAVPAP